MVGLIISDGWIIFENKTCKNALLGFSQSGDNQEYFWFVFWSLSHYCSAFPVVLIIIIRESNNQWLGNRVTLRFKLTQPFYNKRLMRSFGTYLGCRESREINLRDFLHPWFISGICDGESSFVIAIKKRLKCRSGWSIELLFCISLHQKDRVVLEHIKSYFGVGNIYNLGSQMIQFRVESIKGLQMILNHFDRYPLITSFARFVFWHLAMSTHETQKRADYLLFKQAVILVQSREHLTKKGIEKIVGLKASVNLGLNAELKAAFPGIVLVTRPLITVGSALQKILVGSALPNWLAGFTTGEGCFTISAYKSKTKIGIGITLTFQLTQHISFLGLNLDIGWARKPP